MFFELIGHFGVKIIEEIINLFPDLEVADLAFKHQLFKNTRTFI